jgi:hypothetical protein
MIWGKGKRQKKGKIIKIIRQMHRLSASEEGDYKKNPIKIEKNKIGKIKYWYILPTNEK